MEKPKLVVYAPVYPPRKGGSATYFSTLVELLKEQMDITIVCLEEDEMEEEEWINGVKVLRVLPDEYHSSPLKRYLKVLPRSLSVLSDLKKQGPFILQAHSNGIYGLSASLFSRIWNIPMIKEVQDTSDVGWNLRCGNVKWWVSCGDHVKERLKGFKIPGSKIRSFKIINPPDFVKHVDRLKKKVKKDKDPITMVYVGWLLNRVKGVDDLLKAFKLAYDERKDLCLVVIGDGPDREELENMAEGYPIEFTGDLEPEEVARWYLRSHFTVMASHEEAAGRIYTEGYEAGLPAIGTRVGGTPEVLIDGRTGILVEDGDTEGFRDAILKMVDDEKLRKDLGKNGKEFLSEIGTWEDIRDWYVSVIYDIWREHFDS